VGFAVGLAAALGVAFMILQLMVWRRLWLAGLRHDTGTYASAFFGLTVFHGLHVLVGLFALTWLALRPRARASMALRLWALYWHMVAIIWAVMFVLVYVL
jgi:heme/copper-type cytochrome/quinol oxidase subunit 3